MKIIEALPVLALISISIGGAGSLLDRLQALQAAHPLLAEQAQRGRTFGSGEFTTSRTPLVYA